MPDAARADEPRQPPWDLDLIEFLVITLPDLSASAATAMALRGLVESSTVRVLDLVGVVTDSSGRYSIAEPELIPALSHLLDVDGEIGGLLSEGDIALACRALRAGSAALILVVEDQWALGLAEAARSVGGQIVGGERIPRHRLEQALRVRGAGPEGTVEA